MITCGLTEGGWPPPCLELPIAHTTKYYPNIFLAYWLRKYHNNTLYFFVTGIFLSGFVAMAAALYSPSDDVVELTASNFQREVVQSDDLWLVEFYAPW